MLKGRHSPVLLDAVMRSKRAPQRGHVKHSTLRAELFLQPSAQRDILVRRLLDVAKCEGLDVDRLVGAGSDTGNLGPRLLEGAEAIADDFPVQHQPMRTLARMEAVVWKWAKGEGRALRRTTARVLHDAVKENHRSDEGLIRVPTSAWIRAHRNLQIGLELRDLHGDHVFAHAPVVERIARALDALHGNSIFRS